MLRAKLSLSDGAAPTESPRRGLLSLAAYIDKVPNRISKKVAGQNNHRDADAWGENQQWILPKVIAGVVQHRAPIRRRRLHAKSEETEAGDGQDHHAEIERRQHGDRGHKIRHEMPGDDPERARAETHRRLHVDLFP